MQQHNEDSHLSRLGAARYLGRSVRWLDYQLRGPRPPPAYRIGKTWLFKKSELDHWLEQFRAKSHIDQSVDEMLRKLRVGNDPS
jgi:hypothetical protein